MTNPHENYSDNNAPITDADQLTELLDATATTWAETFGSNVTLAAITDNDVASVYASDPNQTVEPLVKLAATLINTVASIDPEALKLLPGVEPAN